MPHLPSLPDDAGFGAIRENWPEPMIHLKDFVNSLLYGPSPFSLGERELISAYVSSLNGCRFCFGTHEQAALAHGVDGDLLKAVMDTPETAPLDAKWQPLLRYLKKLTEAPSRIVQSDVSAVMEAGWEELAVVHATLICGYYNMLNRIVDGFGIVSNEDFYRRAGVMIADDARARHVEEIKRQGGPATGAGD